MWNQVNPAPSKYYRVCLECYADITYMEDEPYELKAEMIFGATGDTGIIGYSLVEVTDIRMRCPRCGGTISSRRERQLGKIRPYSTRTNYGLGANSTTSAAGDWYYILNK